MSESGASSREAVASSREASREADTSSRLSPLHIPEDNIKYLYGFSPPPLSAHVDYGTLPDNCLTFYDRHLDEKLVLRRVVPHPALISSFAAIAQAELQDLLDSGIPLPEHPSSQGHNLESARNFAYFKGEPVKVSGSFGVAAFYEKNIAAVCHPITSLILFRPLSWYSSLMWTDYESGKHPNEEDNPFMQNGYSLSVRHMGQELALPSGVLKRLDPKTRKTLKNMARISPVLATWQIYSPSPQTDDVLRKMGRAPIGLSVSATVGALPVPSRSAPTPDALESPVPLPKVRDHSIEASPMSSVSPARRSARLKEGARGSQNIKPLPSRRRFPRIRPPSQRSAVPSNEVLSEELLHHGWNQAVGEDSSFIVYTNGNTERIGFRDRATQTLFLSDVIDVSKSDPAYVRVHIGLYIAAFRDSVDRCAQIKEKERSAGNPTETALPPASKRRKVDLDPAGPSAHDARSQEVDETHMKRLFVEASSRNLLLVRLSCGVHNSIVPASFFRCGPTLFPTVLPAAPPKNQVSYTANEYISVTIGQHIGTGATGAVHDATLELRTKDGQTLTQNVVIKLAFFIEQRQRMRHEFVAYEQLSASNVKGIPAVLGLFDDVEGSANALIMNHCGIALSRSRLLEDQINVRVSEAEKAAFLDIIKNIHEAGVRHRDMRADNLLLDEDGTATIIDFDRAELNPPPAGRKREYGRLKSLLDGHFTDGDSVRT